MPRTKRTLAETDSNAEAFAPPPKRTSTGKGPEDENDVPATAAATRRGGKPPVGALLDQLASPAKQDKTAKQASATLKKSVAKKPEPKDASSTTTRSKKAPIYICRPAEHSARELGIDLDSEQGAKLVTCGGPKCMCKKLADGHPEYNWIATKTGFELLLKWMDELSKRDQDNFGMYIYNDFTGYGTMEVMENMLLSFEKEFKKSDKKGHPAEMALSLWKEIEAMAFFLNAEFEANLLNDAEGLARCTMTMGTALLTTISVLIKHGLFKDGNPVIRNLGLVLSNFLYSDACDGDLCLANEHGWSKVVVRLADKHGVTIKGVSGIEEVVNEMREEASEYEEDSGAENVAPRITKEWKKAPWMLDDEYDEDGARLWKRWDWSKELARYGRGGKFVPHGGLGRIGGKDYDLTCKATMARAKKYAERYEINRF